MMNEVFINIILMPIKRYLLKSCLLVEKRQNLFVKLNQTIFSKTISPQVLFQGINVKRVSRVCKMQILFPPLSDQRHPSPLYKLHNIIL